MSDKEYVFYSTLEEAIDALVKSSSPIIPALRKKMLTCNNLISRNTFCRTGILCGRPNSLLMMARKENVCRS